ncbi:hypothetical protein NE237_020473 [Protea cynaroides]|uniref:H15 domain-containing protein n=1 Tax=Protea cynaroides TaxID=273540 RepID=A0A9Q0H960_9MAGN|nr:hypothetical protein NE237_020473 [Protea cynaroides]
MDREEESDGRLRIACDNIVRRVKQRKMQSVTMDVLKRGVMRRLSMSSFHQKHSAERRKLIEDRLCAVVPQIVEHNPNHPPYSEMIERAIQRLEEEGGSTEASISSYIGSTYRDLPWAHSHLLPHHLRKLTEAGEIITAPNSRYSLPLPNPTCCPEQQSQPHDDDSGDDTFPAKPITTRLRIKPRKEPSQRPQLLKGGRRNRTKELGSEQKETPAEVQVETERKQPSLRPEPHPQLQRGKLPWNRGRGQQTHMVEAGRIEHFDGEGSVVHPTEPPVVGSGEKVVELEASLKETSQPKRGPRSRRGQKQSKEAIGTETKGLVGQVDCDILMTQAVEPRPVVIEEKEPSVNKDEEPLPLLHSSSSPGEPVNQPEEVRTGFIDAPNNDGTSMVSCNEITMAAVGETEASVSNDEEPLQMVVIQTSSEQVKQAEARTTANDANDSLMVLFSGPIVEDKEVSASVGEDGDPFETQQQLQDKELKHPGLGSFAIDVCNHGPIALSSGNPVVEEKEASVTECRQFSQQQQQHLSALVDELQKHPEVGTAASVANNDDLLGLSIGPLPVVEYGVKEKENPEEQPHQEQQLSLHCTDDEDDVVFLLRWNTRKSVKKEIKGKPKKQSGLPRRRSLRLAEQYQHGNEPQTEPLTGALLALPSVKIEVEEASVMEMEVKEKEKQPWQRQQKPHSKDNHLKKEKKDLEGKAKEKKDLGTKPEEKKDLETEVELSEQWQKDQGQKKQSKRQREEQNELGTEMETSQKKPRDKHVGEEPKEMGMEMELSQQQTKQLCGSGKEPQLQQKQQALEGQRKPGRPPKGPGLQPKPQASKPKGQGKRGRPPKQTQQAPTGEGKLGKSPNGPGLWQKQGGSIMKESNQLGKKTTPLSLSVDDGDVQSNKSQMAEIDQEPSVLQKKARD